jgi:hypothetical protein
MLIPNKFNGYRSGRRTYNTGMEPLLISAALGGGSAALRGGDMDDIVKGALFGGITGGIGGQVFNALGTLGSAAPSVADAAVAASPEVAAGLTGAEAGMMAGDTSRSLIDSLLGNPNQGLLQAMSESPGMMAGVDALGMPMEGYGLGAEAAAAQAGAAPPVAAVAPAPTQAGIPSLLSDPNAASKLYGTPSASPSTFGQPTGKPGFLESPTQWWKGLSPTKQLALGAGAGGLGLMALTNRDKVPGQEPYSGALSRFRFNPDTYQAATLPSRMARGGIADLGSYSDGGRLLKGPGDGMSDHIPATIANKRPARLADGEFVIPADVVSHLGNGSTDAGAKQLYAMMDRVRKARTGNPKQGKQINPNKFVAA